MPIWLKEKLFLKETLRRELTEIGGCKRSDLPQLLFSEHHQSHAASAFFFSPYDHAAVLCLDGVGEWATTSVWRGKANNLEPLWEIDYFGGFATLGELPILEGWSSKSSRLINNTFQFQTHAPVAQ